jgi:hypothetical protein
MYCSFQTLHPCAQACRCSSSFPRPVPQPENPLYEPIRSVVRLAARPPRHCGSEKTVPGFPPRSVQTMEAHSHPSETGAKSKIELIGAACQLMFLAGGNHQFAGRWPASSAWPSAAGLNCRLAPRAFFVWAGATGSHTSERVKPRPKDRNFGCLPAFAEQTLGSREMANSVTARS